MKTVHALALLSASLALSAQAQVATALNPQTATPAGVPVVVDIGPHHRVWQTTRVDEAGRTNVSSFTELATGLNFLNRETGLFEASDERFEITGDGFAVARRGQHSVILAPNLNTAEGAIDFQTPDGQRMRSGIIGLNLFDPVSGRSLQIASVTNSIGEQTAPNEITYFDAFDTIRASVRIKNERGQFHQDVLLQERLSPEHLAALGFDAKTVRLEVWTAFYESPTPSIHAVVLKAETNAVLRATMVEPDEVDQILNFGGDMQMPTGRAFMDGADGGKDVRVFKQWMQTPDGKKYLIEAASYSELKPLLDTLPLAQVLDRDAPLLAGHVPPRRVQPAKTGEFQIAQADPAKRTAAAAQVVWDYVTINTGQTNYVFRSDSTYYVSALVNLSGTTTLEAAVIKFTNNAFAKLSVNGSLVCQTSPYRMALLTSKDHNTVGETITGSTGNPTNYNGATYLSGGGSAMYKYLRLSYAGTGIWGCQEPGSVWHCQFVSCGTAIVSLDTDVLLHNVLFSKCGTAVSSGYGGNVVRGEHVTADQINTFFSPTNDLRKLTNSILTAVTNLGTNVSLYYCTTNSSGNGIYQTGGAASYYLVSISTNRDSGTTNISASLLADLKKKTTYPPVGITTNINANTTLSPQAQRDSDSQPDRGFHYDPLDFVISAVTLTNATLTLTNGVVLGTWPGSNANPGILYVRSGGKLVSEGSPTQPNILARYLSVQEGSPTNAVNNGTFVYVDSTATAPEIRCRFTDWSALSGSGDHLTIYNLHVPFSFTDGRFTGSKVFLKGTPVGLTNCLWERVAVDLKDDDEAVDRFLYNNLFRGGTLTLYRSGTGACEVRDTLFDQTTITQSGTITHDYNGYVTNKNRLSSNGANDVILTNSPVYQTGYLGNYYYPINDGMLSLLMDAGSRNAADAGLYHYTTTTYQWEETSSPVDIGFHYVAVGTNGLPMDTDGDGLPDYADPDSDGDGLPDSWEIGYFWDLSQTPTDDSDGDCLTNQQEYEADSNPADQPVVTSAPTYQIVPVGSIATFAVTMAQACLRYQWYRDSTLLTGATNTSLTLTSVQLTNNGLYNVIASSRAGTASPAARLVVLDAPAWAVWTNFITYTNGKTDQLWTTYTLPTGWPSNYTHQPSLAWNTNCLLFGKTGFTGISQCNEWQGNPGQLAVTALTKRHGYMRGHSAAPYLFSTNADYAGKKVFFCTADNQVVERTVAATFNRNKADGDTNDYTMVIFTNDLPSSITPLSVMAAPSSIGVVVVRAKLERTVRSKLE